MPARSQKQETTPSTNIFVNSKSITLLGISYEVTIKSYPIKGKDEGEISSIADAIVEEMRSRDTAIFEAILERLEFTSIHRSNGGKVSKTVMTKEV